jgi:hypothetical protein
MSFEKRAPSSDLLGPNVADTADRPSLGPGLG